ncbi:hypothetical protein [Micromonospora craniellae]|uniref:Uncharacterized protein n=1 Tax=Micromonospora craniellae TaxID=2294034 RepID=A0A372G2M8_9ACTN|nr:hypothetical protein [Micromonospora craniellae]QOC92703.1 hypothetical protein ID554_02775 [Micromonospora craniellae]RFS46970.1 hypothetical protein D0Q02_08675 [Micromonospora craniellae]
MSAWNAAARTSVSPGVYLLTREASPQFSTPVLVRVIRKLDRPTYDGWAWVDVYQLDRHGDATARRALFLKPAGMRPVQVPPVPYAQRSRPRSATRSRP